ncbi:putative cAMP specific phosphodiesterase [Leishmania infantum JPCM5]|uniref:Phosphodiesterase n=2 Tax=Leishmania infantum TaxID=5671 RepID=A0A6L0X4B0_LEIIN|nr:putative cAMP specific phosphodiesterase [Leishmania infantum JPCM5]CAC9473526.1 cAMP_specific_phosphodiesterase_-_putative [Leishmania infantum]CAM66867.1 putative cAMP specific phosphodiesterase [Leishmania infantum JPCM5]SUZ40568.1 cAMP_specific_phosphodiesterase_-_putative [Leishmania infantum]|eukprot:XP_001464478.1 putative cAMP specific phosphodiesterase [Leishmania infantum JPCM5]
MYSAVFSPAAPYCGVAGSSHLCEAVALCQSILARYRRTGTSFSSTELKAIQALRTELPDTAQGPAANSAGSPHQTTNDLLNILDDATDMPHNPHDDIVAFVEECCDNTKDPTVLFAAINERISAVTCSRNVRTYMVITNDNLLWDPVNGVAALIDDVTPLGKCAQAHNMLTIASTLYIPLWFRSELVGCVEAPSGCIPRDKATYAQLLLRSVTVAVRNSINISIRKSEANKIEAMVSMATRLARDTLEESVLVQSIINTAKKLTESDRCSIFLVKADGSLEAHFEDGNVVVLPAGTGIAGHVVESGAVVNIPNAYEDERFNRSVDKVTGYHTRTILCLPIAFEGTIVAVAQLINKLDMVTQSGQRLPRVFGRRDEELFETFSMFAAASLRNCRINETLLKEKKKSDAILDVVALLSNTDIRDVDSIVRHVLHGAKKLLNADRSSMFLLDKERNELYSKMADSANEIRFPCGQGIAGTVAESGVGENIMDAYADSRFNSAVDRQLGYRTQSILCEPIMLNGEVLAVVQLVNKLGDDGSVTCFTPMDRETFQVFSLFAGISINNSHLLEFAVNAGREAMTLSLQRNSITAQRAPKRVKVIAVTPEEREAVMSIDFGDAYDFTSPDFNLFEVREKYSEPMDAAAGVVYNLLWSSGLPEKFGCREQTLLNFILQCRRRYRRVPYHNFYHVVDVCQTLHTYLYTGKASELLTELECYVLLVTALVHDLDHMGVNNSFYLKTDSPLGILSSASGNNSVLEVHHCSLAIEILSDPAADVFEGLSGQDVAYAYRALIDCVLATDMAKHADALSRFTELATSGFDKENEAHRRMVMETLIKAGDVSNVTKPFETSRMWAMAVTEEFYRQGDMEKEKGVEVLPMFDRSKNNELARGQIGFIDFVAGKFFRDIVGNLFHGMQWCVDTVNSNRAKWQEILDGRRDSTRSSIV